MLTCGLGSVHRIGDFESDVDLSGFGAVSGARTE